MFTDNQLKLMFTFIKTDEDLFKVKTILNKYSSKFSKSRLIMFIALLNVISRNFTYLDTLDEYNLTFSDLQIKYPSIYKNSKSNLYLKDERNPRNVLSRIYAGKFGNMGFDTEDGYNFRPRGAIKIKGRTKYNIVGKSFKYTDTEMIKYLETPLGALDVSLWLYVNDNYDKYENAIEILKYLGYNILLYENINKNIETYTISEKDTENKTVTENKSVIYNYTNKYTDKKKKKK